jgi:hypothetical protein
MWKSFAKTKMRMAMDYTPSACIFPSDQRFGWSHEARLNELEFWWEKVRGYPESVRRELAGEAPVQK